MGSVDWHSVFVPSIGILEVMLRGTIMYLALFAILRFIGRRQAGHFGPADLLVIVLIADAAQNGLGKDYQSVTEGIVLVLTIVALGISARLAGLALSAIAIIPEASSAHADQRRARCPRCHAQGDDQRGRTQGAASRTGRSGRGRGQAGPPRWRRAAQRS